MQTARYRLFGLLNTASVTDLLDTFTVGVSTYPALFNNKIIPATYQDLVKTAQIFHVSSYGSGDYIPQTFQVSCRAPSEPEAIEIAQAVYDAVNRVFYDGKYFVAVIQPAIEEDLHWLVPVEITHKG